MNFRLKFWRHHLIPRSRFPYRVRYFGDTRTFSDNFCIGYGECPPYLYFCSSWPTDLESVSRDAHLAVTVSTKFEVDTTIRCLIIALLLLIHNVTLWPWPLTFWLWSVVIHGATRNQAFHQVWISYGWDVCDMKGGRFAIDCFGNPTMVNVKGVEKRLSLGLARSRCRSHLVAKIRRLGLVSVSYTPMCLLLVVSTRI